MNRNPMSQFNQASSFQGSPQARPAGSIVHCSRLLTDDRRGTVEILRGPNGRLRSISTVIEAPAIR
jgi:hypothetical protein